MANTDSTVSLSLANQYDSITISHQSESIIELLIKFIDN